MIETKIVPQHGMWDIQVASGDQYYAPIVPGNQGLRFIRQDMETEEMWESVGDGDEERWEEHIEGEWILDEGEGYVGGRRRDEVNHWLERELAAMTAFPDVCAGEDYFLQEQYDPRMFGDDVEGGRRDEVNNRLPRELSAMSFAAFPDFSAGEDVFWQEQYDPRTFFEGEVEVGGGQWDEVNCRLGRELAAMSFFTALPYFQNGEDYFLQEQYNSVLHQNEQPLENIDPRCPLVLDADGQRYGLSSLLPGGVETVGGCFGNFGGVGEISSFVAPAYGVSGGMMVPPPEAGAVIDADMVGLLDEIFKPDEKHAWRGGGRV